MRVLFISNLFPDTAIPHWGLDNARVLHCLRPECEIRVVAPRPALPVLSSFWGKAPSRPRPDDAPFEPIFPRVPYVPKVGSRWNHLLFASGIEGIIRHIHVRFPFDVILCTWMYPDGCAVRRVALSAGWPYVLIAPGSDVHTYLRHPVRRPLIVDAANRSQGVIARSRDLACLLEAAGAGRETLHAIHNGVDTRSFSPGDSSAARTSLGLPPDDHILLFVGNLVPVKNPLLVIAAHAEVSRRLSPRRCHLVLVGDGPLRKRVRSHADALGYGRDVHLVGRRGPSDVATYLRAADLLCLSSDNEGVPNVVLEAFACGRRVVATDVGGVHEVLDHRVLGRLVEPRNASALAEAICATLAEQPSPEVIADHGRRFSWERTAASYLAVLRQALPASHAPAATASPLPAHRAARNAT